MKPLSFGQSLGASGCRITSVLAEVELRVHPSLFNGLWHVILMPPMPNGFIEPDRDADARMTCDRRGAGQVCLDIAPNRGCRFRTVDSLWAQTDLTLHDETARITKP